ncbi:MAG: hypothetical protein AB4368_27730 [Xenococcaceae cyanobacterium]
MAEILENIFNNNKRSTQEKTLKTSSHNNVISVNFGREILISRSGQLKLENLESCLELVSSDFIVF